MRMEISAAADERFERGDDGRFDGEVWLRSTLAAVSDDDDEGFA
jgi:hypothetical protein